MQTPLRPQSLITLVWGSPSGEKFFKELFCAPNGSSPIPFSVQSVPKLTEEMGQQLTKPISNEEVSGVSTQCTPISP